MRLVWPFAFMKYQVDTLPEINIAPENRQSQKETSLPTIHFQVRIQKIMDLHWNFFLNYRVTVTVTAIKSLSQHLHSLGFMYGII